MPAECQIGDCGVLAVGRCIQCGLAFCTSHRALRDRTAGGGHFTNLCAPCKDKEDADRIAADPEAQAMPVINSMRTMFMQLDVPKEEIVWTRYESQRIREGLRRRTGLVEVVDRKEAAWLIGPVTWTVDVGQETYRLGVKTFETAVPADHSIVVGHNFVVLHQGKYGWHATKPGLGTIDYVDAARAIKEVEQRYRSGT